MYLGINIFCVNGQIVSQCCLQGAQQEALSLDMAQQLAHVRNPPQIQAFSLTAWM